MGNNGTIASNGSNDNDGGVVDDNVISIMISIATMDKRNSRGNDCGGGNSNSGAGKTTTKHKENQTAPPTTATAAAAAPNIGAVAAMAAKTTALTTA